MHKHIDGPSCPGCDKELQSAHPYMKDWFHRRKAKHPDMHAAWVYRGKVDQNLCLAKKSSDLGWPHSPHNRRIAIDPSKLFDPSNESDPNTTPESLAIDVFQINAQFPRGCWSIKFMRIINDESVYEKAPVKWGAMFKDLGDFTHFQLELSQLPSP